MNKKWIFLASAVLGGFCWAQQLPAEDDVIKNAIEAREQSAQAVRLYNDADSANRNAVKVADDCRSNLEKMRQRLFELKQTQWQTGDTVENLGARFDILESQFKQDCEFLDKAQANIKALAKQAPLAQGRIETARELAKKGMEYVNLNPGEQLKDRTYFSRVVADFSGAVNSLERIQQEMEKIGISLAIAQPRIKGISQALKLYKDFSGKAGEFVKTNNDRVDEFSKSVKSLETDYLKISEALSSCGEALRSQQAELLRTALSVQMLLLNDLPNSEKYRDVTFPPLNSRNLVRVYGSLNLAKDSAFLRSESVDGLKRKLNNGSGNARYLNPSTAAYAEAAGASSGMRTSVSSEGVNPELLKDANTLVNITAELNYTAILISNVLEDADAAMGAIEQDEQQAQSLLREGMDVFTRTQGLSADLEIFGNTIAVSKAQMKVSNAEFEKLDKQCRGFLIDCNKACEAADAACERARKAL